MRGGTGILQSGPRKDSNQRNWILAHRDREVAICRPSSGDGDRQQRGGTGRGGSGD
jgi:hypothetical protein